MRDYESIAVDLDDAARHCDRLAAVAIARIIREAAAALRRAQEEHDARALAAYQRS